MANDLVCYCGDASGGSVRSQLIRLTAAMGLVLLVIATAYAMAGPYGERLLRSELQTQLSQLLQSPVSIQSARMAWNRGPEIAAHHLETFRSEDNRPLFTADQVFARLDLSALLFGNLRLEWLRIERARLEIHREGRAQWQPEALFGNTPQASGDPQDLESFFDPLRDLETITRGLLEMSEAFLQIDIEDSRLLFFDSAKSALTGNPPSLHLTDIRAELIHDESTGSSRLEWNSLLKSPDNDDAPLKLDGAREADGVHWIRARLDGAPIPPLVSLLIDDPSRLEATGNFDLDLAFETTSPGSGDLSLKAALLDFESSLFLREEPLQIESPRLEASLELQFDPQQIELRDLTVEGLARGGRLLVAGSASRPLLESTRVRFSAELRGAGQSQLRSIIAWLPRSDAEPLERILGRVTGGQISSIGASGRLRVSQWNNLLRGRLSRVPRAFVLAAKMEDLEIGSPSGDVLAQLTGEVQWSGDRIELRETQGLWNGRSLPEVELSAEGISLLFDGPDALRDFKDPAPDLPGLEPLMAWFDALDVETREPGLPAPLVRVHLESLEHPALRWPVRDTSLQLSPIEQGTELRLITGQWAGASIEGEALFLRQPTERWLISIRMSPGSDQPSPLMTPDNPALPHAWARGTIETASLETENLPILGLGAKFSFRGTQLYADEIEAVLDSAGTLQARAELDLAEATSAPFYVEGVLKDARLEDLAAWIDPTADWGTGDLDALLEVRGQIAPNTPILSTTRGQMTISAREGEIRYDVPLALAVAQATIGFNPSASRDGTAYDSIDVDLDLTPGRISTENFALYGETRVFASGEIMLEPSPSRIDAVVGIFLLGGLNRVLDKVPLVRNLVSKKGLVGSYFAVVGPLDEPDVRSLPAESIQEAVPHIFKVPFLALGALPSGEKKTDDQAPETRAPSSKRGQAH